jgi:hypothetical protein
MDFRITMRNLKIRPLFLCGLLSMSSTSVSAAIYINNISDGGDVFNYQSYLDVTMTRSAVSNPFFTSDVPYNTYYVASSLDGSNPINHEIYGGRLKTGAESQWDHRYPLNIDFGDVGQHTVSVNLSGTNKSGSDTVNYNVVNTPDNAKVKLDDGSVYEVPFLQNKNDLSSFYVKQNGQHLDLNSLSTDKLSKLIAFSQSLNDYYNFDATVVKENLEQLADSSRNSAIADGAFATLSVVTTNALAYGGAILASAASCEATTGGLTLGVAALTCAATTGTVGAVSTTVSVTSDLLTVGTKAATNAFLHGTASGITARLFEPNQLNSNHREYASNIHQVDFDSETMLTRAINGEVIDFADFSDLNTRFNSTLSLINTAETMYSTMGIDFSVVGDLSSNITDIWTLGAVSTYQMHLAGEDAETMYANMQNLIQESQKFQLGYFSSDSLTWNNTLAICQGIIEGDCPDGDIGDVARLYGNFDEVLAELVVRDLHFQSSDFGQGTDVTWTPSLDGVFESIMYDDGNSLGLFTAGSPVAITTLIDTPESSFDIFFDYQFLSTSGLLEVYLDDILLDTLYAPTNLVDMMLSHHINVLSDDFLNLTDIELTFLYNGPTGTQMLIDDIGINDGAFSSANLARNYESQSESFVVPEPSILALYTAGLAGLYFVRRRKQQA